MSDYRMSLHSSTLNMAGLKLEGDLDNISEIQLAYIKDVLEKRGFKNAKVLIEPVGKVGDNFVANVKRITVEDETTGTFKMVAKIAPNHEVWRMMANTLMLFKNEHIMYTKVLPKFDELQKAADIPEEQKLRYAACYGSFEEAPNEVILLEDLKEAKFEMMDKLTSLSDECVKSVLKNFAMLHSLSFALKHKEPTLFEEYKNSLFDLWSAVAGQEESKLYFSQLEASAIMIMQSDIHKKVLKGIISESMNKFGKLAHLDRDSKSAVIQQGDSWTNNIMFKFDGEKLLESIMIDYQLSKVSNPVCDLHYMLFNCTDYKSRKEHFYDWIDYYHNELDKSLSAFGLKANFVFPRDQLDVDLKRYGRMNLGQSIILASVTFLKPEEAGQMKEAMEAADMQNIQQMTESATIERLGIETLAIFKSRVEGLIDSHLDFGFL